VEFYIGLIDGMQKWTNYERLINGLWGKCSLVARGASPQERFFSEDPKVTKTTLKNFIWIKSITLIMNGQCFFD